MLDISKWLTGLIFAIIQLLENSGGNSEPCSTDDTIPLEPVITCVDILTLPPDVREDIESLELRIYVSKNRHLTVKKIHLMKFTNLKNLVIQTYRATEVEMSHDVLQPLSKLELLNMSQLHTPFPEIPHSVKILIASSLGNNSHPDMSSLEKLEKLVYKSNYQENFPKLPEIAPLMEADLGGNPLENMTYHDLSHYCLLRNISFKGSLVSNDPVRCCGIKIWLRDVNVSTDLYCEEHDANCDETFGERNTEADDIYYNCLVRTGQLEQPTAVENVLHYFVAAALILALAYLVYKYYGSHAVKSHRQSLKIESQAKSSFFDDDDDEDDEEDPEEDSIMRQ